MSKSTDKKSKAPKVPVKKEDEDLLSDSDSDDEPELNPKDSKPVAGLPLDVRKPPFMILAGSPGSGKSYFAKQVIYELACKQKLFHWGRVFSTSSEFNDDWECMPKHSVLAWDLKVFNAYVEGLKKEKRKRKAEGKPMPMSFCAFDDLQGKKNYMDEPSFIEFMAIHRHLGVACFFLVQYLAKGVNTVCKCMMTHGIAWQTKTPHAARVYLAKNFGASIPAKQDEKGKVLIPPEKRFLQMFDKVTSVEHQALVFYAQTKDPKQAYRSYIAPAELPNFKLKFKT